ncbi:MAG: purine-nucleoside phosphorylase [Lachnospiraceae bacterium]|nr:purine-nucleoside phosphorylase [Lachnospiraceae bacterium]
MSKEYEKLQDCLSSVRNLTDFKPEIGVVLGSGLGDFADGIDVEWEIDYSSIPGFPVSTVKGHSGKFIFGTVGGKRIVCMKGRVHFYEGYPISDVVLPIRLMGLMGADKLILTNAAGGLHPEWKPGTLMLITDHISAFARNPLIGPNIEELGTRFPDMSDVYKKDLSDIIRSVASKGGIALKEGVYSYMTGPSYETPAEIRALRTLGADAVGMSTVPEAIAANHMGTRVCGISCITNYAAGISDKPLGHEEVQQAADKVSADFKKLIAGVIAAM